jgi:UDP-GlcNAc:undecaprenyl-phosphate GlcNAc-1-phosphate transferase
MNLLLAFIVAMAVTMALVPLLVRWATRMQVLDIPAERKLHAAPMPRVGGMAMVAGTLLALVIWLPRDDIRLLAYIAGAAIIFAFGVWDDREDLPAGAKVAGQLLAILIVVGFGGVRIDAYTLTERHLIPPLLGLPLTALFILGVTNAINLSDGLDGLAGGTTLLIAAALFLLARASGDVAVAVTAMSLCGALLGFLRFNTFPARIFMGDGGSQFLGFTVAVLAVLLMQRPDSTLSTAVPLMLLGLPVVDTLMVMAQRLREGRSIFSADKHHLHHKLLGLGFDHHEAVVVIYSVQGLFFLTGWLMRYEPDPVILLTFAAMAIGVVAILIVAGRADWRWRRPGQQDRVVSGKSSVLRRTLLWLRKPERLPHWALRVAVFCTLAYLLSVAGLVDRATPDLMWLALALLAVLLLILLSPTTAARLPWLPRAALYIGAAMAVYLEHITTDRSMLMQAVKFTALPLLAVAVVVRMRLSKERRFELTTLDILLIFIALVVPNLPGLAGAPSNLGLSILKLIVLIYAIELCSDQSPGAQRALSAGVALAATVVVARAMLG